MGVEEWRRTMSKQRSCERPRERLTHLHGPMILNNDLFVRIRTMAKQGIAPAQIVRETLAFLRPEEQSRQTLVHYFSQAFCFTEGQAQTLFGWLPEGAGYMTDRELDGVLSKKISATREHWDQNSTVDKLSQ